MKNYILTLAFAVFGFALQAQEGIKLGLQGGLPLDEFNDTVGVVLGIDAGYMWALGEVVDLGVMTGFINGFPEKYNTKQVVNTNPNVQFVPVAASVRVWLSNSFSFGVDGGKAFGINKGNDGGIYYRPVMGYLLGPNTELNVSYTGVKMDNITWTTATIGVVYTINMRKL